MVTDYKILKNLILFIQIAASKNVLFDIIQKQCSFVLCMRMKTFR